jgi:hypothetical protein
MLRTDFGWAIARESSLDRPRDGSFCFADCRRGTSCDGADTQGTQVAETPDKETQGDKQPEAVPQGVSSRVTVTMVSLAALAVIGAATANFLPNIDLFSLPSLDRFSLPKFDRVSLPKFDQISLPKFDQISLPNFSRIALPKSDRVAAQPPPKPAPVLVPDPIVRAALRDIQSSQQQNADVLVSLTQGSETQQSDLRKISRQIYVLTAQVNALQGAAGPLTTGSIPHPKARARLLRTSRKIVAPIVAPLPKPVGPVSVGGAPLGPASAQGSGV